MQRLFVTLFFITLFWCLNWAKTNQAAHNQTKIDASVLQVQFDHLKEKVENLLIGSRYAKAERELKNFHSRFKKTPGYPSAEVNLLFAKTYRYEMEYDQSLVYFIKAINGFKKNENYAKLVECGAELVEFYRKQGKYKEGEEVYYRYAFLVKLKNVQHPESLNKLYNRFAAVLNESNRAKLAIKYSKLAILEARKTGDQYAVAVSLNEMGFAYKNLSDEKSSAELYQKAYDIWFTLGCYRDAIQAKMNKITLLAHNELISWDEQIVQAKEVLDFLNSHQLDFSKQYPLEVIRTAYVGKKDYEKALYYEQHLTGAKMESQVKVRDVQVTNIQEKYDNENLLLRNNQIKQSEQNKKKELKKANQLIWAYSILIVVFIVGCVALLVLWKKLKITNKLLRKRNEQKTFLVQEIHHRVKNNLQFVRSMLEMQMAADSMQKTATSLEDVSRRIDAMSLVHEMLYVGDDEKGISVQAYLNRLIQCTTVLYDSSHSYDWDIDVEQVELGIEKSVALGIICSELVAAAIKNTLDQTTTQKITIRFYKKKNTFHFELNDNSDISLQTTDVNQGKLGMRLVDIFSRQLNGQYELNRNEGLHYHLSFT